MLPKKRRVKIADFNKNPKSPIKKYSTNFSLFKKGGNKKGWKFAINIPFQTDKRASRRNYSRRITEKVIREEYNNLNGGGEALIKVKKNIDQENKELMEAELRRILNNEFSW